MGVGFWQIVRIPFNANELPASAKRTTRYLMATFWAFQSQSSLSFHDSITMCMADYKYRRFYVFFQVTVSKYTLNVRLLS